MKKLILFAIVLFAASFTLHAQETQVFVDQDYCIFQDGMVMRYTNGMPKYLKESYVLKNGSVINPDGTYTLKNKKQLQLQDGECLGMSGHKYKNEQQLFSKQQMQKKKVLKKTKTKGKRY